MEEVKLTSSEIAILALVAINVIDSGELRPGVIIHPSLVARLESAYSKLIKVLEENPKSLLSDPA